MPCVHITRRIRGSDDAPAGRQRSGRRRTLTVLRRIGLGMLSLILVITAASAVLNWSTEPPQVLDPGFGRYVRVGAAEVHYQEWGDRGSPIVLIPGAFESSIVWMGAGPLLGVHHRVYALDLAWHGYTRDPGPVGLAAQAQLVDGFIRAVHLPRPALIGHSLGAAVVASVALAHPKDISRIVFADGDGLPIPIGTGFGRAVLRAVVTHTPYLTSLLRIAARWPSRAESLIGSLCGRPCPGLTPQLAQQWVRPFGQQSEVDFLHRWFAAESYGLTDTQIASVRVPAAIIWGTEDRNGGSLSATITNLHHPRVHLIQGANHLSMMANPAEFARDVEAALAGR